MLPRHFVFAALVAVAIGSAVFPPLCLAQEPLKLGIIGLDTSHVTRFAELLNDPARKEHVQGAVIVAAYKGGSRSVADSANRIDNFTKEVTTKYGVQLVATIPELCRRVDAVLLLSVDARQHLDQVRLVFAAKKRVFIDKPLAGSLKDAREIVKLSRESGVPFFSCSNERYSKPIADLKHDATLGRIEGAITFGPSPIESYLPDLFWYGIHSVESLYELMGPGCERGARVHTEGEDSVVGTWKDGRIGEIRGLRSSPHTYGAAVFGANVSPPAGIWLPPVARERRGIWAIVPSSGKLCDSSKQASRPLQRRRAWKFSRSSKPPTGVRSAMARPSRWSQSNENSGGMLRRTLCSDSA